MYKVEPNKSIFDLHNYEHIYSNDKKCYVYCNKILKYIQIKPYTDKQKQEIDELNKRNFLTEQCYWSLF